MRRILAAGTLFGLSIFGQTVERSFTFTQIGGANEFQEIVNIIRSMADIDTVPLDREHFQMTVRGSAGQVAAVEWLHGQMDKAPAEHAPDSVSDAYSIPGPRSEVVRICYLNDIRTPQGIQQIVNLIRSIADLQRVFPLNAQHALAIRGSEDQLTLAQWLLSALDRPAPAGSPVASTADFRLPDPYAPDVRLFILGHAAGAQEMQRIVNAVRNRTQIQRAFPFAAQNALVVRGTDAQTTEAEQMIQQIDKR